MRIELITVVEKCISWIEKEMLTFDHGYWGIYERIRIDERIRTNWVRPDCNSEFARVLDNYKRITGNTQYEKLKENIINWILRTQDKNEYSIWRGSFPFYLIDGKEDLTPATKSIYQNDNGKVMIALLDIYRNTGDERLLDSVKMLAEFWKNVQRPEGYFKRLDGRIPFLPPTPCFVLWLAAGFMMCGNDSGDPIYKEVAKKAYGYLKTLQKENGRMLTSYELGKIEDWRPVSSETCMAVYAFARGYRECGDTSLLEAMNKAGTYLLGLQHETGAILICNDDCKDASLQNNKDLCDLVYTGGYALMALIEAYKACGDEKYLKSAKKLGKFFIDIQCSGESPLWDGAWRGSYNVVTGKWDGRADQNNPIDEGGMYSVYTGWCNTTIMNGLLYLAELL
jgi:rhamnogalacturonyl hydrolase YesR